VSSEILRYDQYLTHSTRRPSPDTLNDDKTGGMAHIRTGVQPVGMNQIKAHDDLSIVGGVIRCRASLYIKKRDTI
jgi:hypothetical protein